MHNRNARNIVVDARIGRVGRPDHQGVPPHKDEVGMVDVVA